MSEQFLFVGNHPAVDFVNTELIDSGRLVDLLVSTDDLQAWLHAARLADRRPWKLPASLPAAVRRALLDDAKALRSAIRGALERLAAGQPVATRHAAVIGRTLARCPGRLHLGETDDGWEVSFQADAAAPTSVLAPIAQAAADLLAHPGEGTVRQCEHPGCVLWFLDRTRNRSRRWCSMSACGNRQKAAAYYRRQRGLA